MDELDIALLDAWNRLSKTVRTNRAERARRGARRLATEFSRPLRPWCLCIRASDTRLDSIHILRVPEKATDTRDAHDVELTSDDLRRLTAPVIVDFPGVDWHAAARSLGRTPESIRHWFNDPNFNTQWYAPAPCRKRGKNVPHIFAPGALDPGSAKARPQDHFFFEAWTHHHTRIPTDLAFTLRRLPRFRPDTRGHTDERGRFRGWQFICPGLPDLPPCGRVVNSIFWPLPIRDLPALLGAPDPLADSPTATPPPFVPACHHCHRIRYLSPIDRSSWNVFVTHFSRGLLYGRDVPRPDMIPQTRTRRFAPHIRPAPRRERVKALLLEGLTYQQIADQLAITWGTVAAHVKRLYRIHNVHSRAQLAKTLGVELPPARAASATTAYSTLPRPTLIPQARP